MKYEITAPDAVKQELWNEESIYRMVGGFKLDTANLPSTLTILPKGCLLNINFTTRVAKIVKTAKVYETSAADATAYKVYKNHILKADDVITKVESAKAYTVQSIDTSNADYDVVAVNNTLGELVENDVLFEAAAETADSSAQKAQANFINYHDVKIEGTPSVNALGRAYEIKEAKLPYPVHALNKTSLTSRFMFV